MKRHRFFLVKTRDYYETKVALALAQEVRTYKVPVYSILVPGNLKGFIIVEANSHHDITPLLREVKHTRGLMRRNISHEEVFKMLDPPRRLFIAGQRVDVRNGPFKGMEAYIVTDDGKKVTVQLPEWEHPGEITINRGDLGIWRPPNK